MKKILSRIAGTMIGLACDAALIHNFFYQDRWNRYCQNYISAFKVLSWIIFAAMIVVLISRIIAAARPDYLKSNIDMFRKSVDNANSLYSKIYFYANTLPMIFFVWVFVGDYHLGTVWGLCAILTVWGWEVSKKVQEAIAKLDSEPQFNIDRLSKNQNFN